MYARLLTAVATVSAVASFAVPADAAKRKTREMKESYTLSLPVPFPGMETVPTLFGCTDGPEDLSKDSKAIKLPAGGTLKAQVAFTGDWDLYVVDSKGTMVALAENEQTGMDPGTEKLTWKAKKAQTVTLIACNWAGMKDATVSYVFSYVK